MLESVAIIHGGGVRFSTGRGQGIYRLVKAMKLSKREISINLFAPGYDNEAKIAFEKLGVKVYLFTKKNILKEFLRPHRSILFEAQRIQRLISLVNLQRIRSLRKYSAVVVIPSHPAYNLVFSAIRGTPLIFYIRDVSSSITPAEVQGFFPPRNTVSKILFRTLHNSERMLAKKSDVIAHILFFKDSLDFFVNRILRVNKPAYSLPNSLLKEEIQYLQSIKPAQLDQDKIRFIYVGGLQYRVRGLETLVEAIKYLKEKEPSVLGKLEILLIGDGHMLTELKKLEKEIPAIRVLGKLPRHETIQLLKATDYALLPGNPHLFTTIFNVPTKLFEYLVAGKPIIYHCRYFDVRRLIGELGICYQESKELASIIEKAVKDEIYIYDARRKGLQIAERYVFEKFMDKFLNGLEEIISRS